LARRVIVSLCSSAVAVDANVAELWHVAATAVRRRRDPQFASGLATGLLTRMREHLPNGLGSHIDHLLDGRLHDATFSHDLCPDECTAHVQQWLDAHIADLSLRTTSGKETGR
jgi:hypothetical protein